MSITGLTKIVLSVLFLLCLLDMPYGYYELVRFLATLGFAFLAYEHFLREEKNIGLVYVTLAFLFQPFIKIALGRELWNIIDIAVAIGLLTSLFYIRTKRNVNRQINKENNK